jgi:hypothetical protein
MGHLITLATYASTLYDLPFRLTQVKQLVCKPFRPSEPWADMTLSSLNQWALDFQVTLFMDYAFISSDLASRETWKGYWLV